MEKSANQPIEIFLRANGWLLSKYDNDGFPICT